MYVTTTTMETVLPTCFSQNGPPPPPPPSALAREAMDQQESWMTQSDDGHQQRYPLPSELS
jgi:hypothetical protein